MWHRRSVCQIKRHMRQAYRQKRFHPTGQAVPALILDICHHYTNQG